MGSLVENIALSPPKTIIPQACNLNVCGRIPNGMWRVGSFAISTVRSTPLGVQRARLGIIYSIHFMLFSIILLSCAQTKLPAFYRSHKSK
jgi:hypothetical protein